VSDDGPSRGGPTSGNPNYQVWRDIRDRSVADFVNVVSSALEARYNRKFREQLYEAVFSNGLAPVRWGAATHTGPMLLALYYRGKKEQM